MPTLQADNIGDLVTLTQKQLGRNKWSDISLSLQNYVALPNILKSQKVVVDGGYGLQWNVQVRNAGLARNVGLWETDSVNVQDVMVNASAPWRHTTVSYAIEKHEVSINSGPSRIVDLVQVRRHTAMNDLAEIMETNFWSKPTDSTDTVKPFGVPYWIVKNNSTGFNGGNPSGFTAGAGGLSSSTYANWSNYTAQYTAVTKDDLIRKARAAAYKTNFIAPNPNPNYARGESQRFGHYMNYATLASLEEILEAQNQNLGNDLASKDGMTMFRRLPCTPVAYLDADTTNPWYGIDWSVFQPSFLSGWYMNEVTMPPLSNQHNVIVTHIDNSYNFQCFNRRQLFVLATNT